MEKTVFTLGRQTPSPGAQSRECGSISCLGHLGVKGKAGAEPPRSQSGGVGGPLAMDLLPAGPWGT